MNVKEFNLGAIATAVVFLVIMILAAAHISWAANLGWFLMFIFGTMFYILQLADDEHFKSEKTYKKAHVWAIYLLICVISAALHWYFITIYFLFGWALLKGRIITIEKKGINDTTDESNT